MKKGLLKWLAVMMMVILCVPQVFAASEIRVKVNGSQVYFPDGQPYIDSNSRVLVPVRFVSEQLGAKVNWDGTKQQVTVIDGNKTAVLTINSKKVTVNGASKELDTAAIIKGTRTYVPLRFVSEALGASVTWDSKTRIVSIDNGKAPLPEVSICVSGNFNIPITNGASVNKVGDSWYIETSTQADIWFNEDWASKGNLLVLVTQGLKVSYAEQCDEIENLLAQDISLSDAKKIMDYARNKKSMYENLTKKTFSVKDYTVTVSSNNSESTEIRVIHK